MRARCHFVSARGCRVRSAGVALLQHGSSACFSYIYFIYGARRIATTAEGGQDRCVRQDQALNSGATCYTSYLQSYTAMAPLKCAKNGDHARTPVQTLQLSNRLSGVSTAHGFVKCRSVIAILLGIVNLQQAALWTGEWRKLPTIPGWLVRR